MAAGVSALLIVVGGGAIGIAVLATGDGDRKPGIVTELGQAAAAPAGPPASVPGDSEQPVRPPAFRGHAAPAEARAAEPADRTATRNPATRRSSKPTPAAAITEAPATPAPVTTTRTEVETREIPFETRLVRDPALPRGTRRVETPGVAGVETLRYLVTVTDGRTTERQLIDATVTKQPQHRIVAFGTRRAAAQDPRCGQALHVCVPLGRKAICPGAAREDTGVGAAREEDTGVAGLGGSVVVLDEDVALLDDLEELAC